MHNAKNTRLLPSRRWTAKEDFGQSLSAATDQSVSTGQGPAILRSISFMIRWTDRFLKSRVSYRTVSVSFVRIHAKTRRGTPRKWGIEVLSILRTIAIIDIATNAALAAVAWLFGMTWTQTVGAGLVALIVIAVVLGWRQVVNAPRPLRQDWQRLSADHADRLPTPRAVAEIVAPQQRQLEAPRRELTTWHNGTE